MNKLYLPVLAVLLVAGSAQAQLTNGRQDLPLLKQFHHPVGHRTTPVIHAADREVLWMDDLSDPSTWVISAVDGGDPAAAWVIGTEGPTGEFSESYGTIESTTAANGFALFDSDLDCGGNQHTVLQMATPVDLSAYPGAILQFEQYFTRFRGDCFVDVSIDGIAWTEFEVNAGVDGNASTDNPELTTLNISSVSANQPAVWVRFRYYSVAGVQAADAGCDYAWMVDDVSISTLPDFEIQMEYGYNSQTGNGEEYGRTPSSQMPATLNMGAAVINFGGMDQTNVVVDIAVTDGAGTDFGISTDIGTMMSGDTVVTDEDVLLPSPLPIGLYNATFTMTSDQIADDENPDNNSAARNFEVTEFIYSLDAIGNHGDVPEILTQTGSGSFEDNPEDVKLLTYYNIVNTMTVTGLEIQLGPASDAGSAVVVSILDTADVLATPSVVNQPLVVSETKVLTAGDIAAGVITVPFTAPIQLSPNGYYAVASLFTVGTSEIYILDDETVPQPGLASALWIPFDPDQNQNFYGGNGTSWAIRMTSDPTIGLQEQPELEGITVGPNPTNGIIRINSVVSEKYTVEVTNVLGEQVMTTSFAGTTTLDLSPFADGVYNVRVSNGTKSTVQRVTLN